MPYFHLRLPFTRWAVLAYREGLGRPVWGLWRASGAVEGQCHRVRFLIGRDDRSSPLMVATLCGRKVVFEGRMLGGVHA